MFLHRALIYKAVDLSLKGIYDVTSTGDFVKSKSVANRMSELDNEDKEFCIAKSKELIELLSPILKRMSPEALEILRNLAERPISQYGVLRPSIIDKKLMANLGNELTDAEQGLLSITILGEITDTTATKWKKKAMKKLGVSQRMVEYIMKKVEDKTGKRFVFDNEFKNYRLV
jgi:hypothetical protein